MSARTRKRHPVRRRRCRHCRAWFLPDRRTAYRSKDCAASDSPLVRHQRFCSAKPCREASRRYTQFKWRWKNGIYDHARAKKDRRPRAAHPDRGRRHRPTCRRAAVTITAWPGPSGRQSIRVRSRFRTTGALQDLSFPKAPADVDLTLIWRSALQDLLVLRAPDCYCRPRASEKPGRNAGRRTPSGSACGGHKGRPEERKHGKGTWRLLNRIVVNKKPSGPPDWVRCLRRWWTSITRPCGEAAAA